MKEWCSFCKYCILKDIWIVLDIYPVKYCIIEGLAKYMWYRECAHQTGGQYEFHNKMWTINEVHFKLRHWLLFMSLPWRWRLQGSWYFVVTINCFKKKWFSSYLFCTLERWFCPPAEQGPKFCLTEDPLFSMAFDMHFHQDYKLRHIWIYFRTLLLQLNRRGLPSVYATWYRLPPIYTTSYR